MDDDKQIIDKIIGEFVRQTSDGVLRRARLPIYCMKTIRILHTYLEWREVRTVRKKPKKGIVRAVHRARSHQSGNPTYCPGHFHRSSLRYIFMTPPESEPPQTVGMSCLRMCEVMSIYVFFYGVSSSLTVRGYVIYNFVNRSIRCALLCIAHYLCVRFFLLQSCLFLNKI